MAFKDRSGQVTKRTCQITVWITLFGGWESRLVLESDAVYVWHKLFPASRNHLSSFGNMAPNRSKSACGSVGNKVYCQKLRLTVGVWFCGEIRSIIRNWGLQSVFGSAEHQGLLPQKLRFTGTTSRVCETYRLIIQSRCSVLQSNKVSYQKLRLAKTTSRVCETWRPTVQFQCLVL
ncbi:uncharacterized protein LACBIDRAFT_327088 [Laccaria bicolor S238N-H82]|uniref:Predicted protein n=1 Tax=Laccaria bicolor (strain S238N-H82 / ATCC MYA-4686) TaxID=486041 RepID=B0DAL8_LACBS|nr:uncharacterized protein LACBIDRAFT_327088 [Laccaria bicolor S238N-H82]EDR08771.1 predicted protein [Laccaria bicolor S238N-H82]|eukprot:XP_001880996.1 predicted protein [Laccaria bicolor S238N-H82]